MDKNVYAEVKEGVITQIIDDYAGDFIPQPVNGGVIIDVTRFTPLAVIGQSVTIRFYATIIDQRVCNVFRWHEDNAPSMPGGTVELIEVTNIFPRPSTGWTYADGIFTAPPEPESE